MKKLICILASAALFGACEQKTEVAPAAPADKTNTTIVNPPPAKSETGAKEKTTTNTITNAPPADGSVEKKTESTTTTSSPNP